MNLRALFVFAALVPALWGQGAPEVRIPESAAPPEVNQALRERVTGFYENHTGSVKRRAIDYVAEDTQDFYFGAKKTVYTKVSIKKIEYTSKNFDRADVTVDASYMMTVETQSFETSQSSVTTWKIEDGKWYWTHDQSAADFNPMSIFSSAAGAAAVKPQAGDAAAKPPVDLKNMSIAEMVAQQQRTILQQSKLDKDTVEFVAGQAGEQQVSLFNGFSGDVSLQIEGGSPVSGVAVTADKTTLHAKENGIVRFKYNPPSDAKPQSGTIRLVLQPFNQTFPVQVVVQSK